MNFLYIERRGILYKLIAVDLDGTLLTDNKEITEENLDTIHFLIELGYEVVVATGRSYYSARRLTDDIKDPLVYIANNGNVVRNSIDDSLLSSLYLPHGDCEAILREGNNRELNPIVHVDYYQEGYDIILDKDGLSKYYDNRLSDNIIRYRKVEDYFSQNLDRVLAIVYPGDRDILMDFHLTINRLYPNRYNSHVMENVVMSDALLEIMNPMGTKWNTLRQYALSKDIKPYEIIAFGDDNNDIDMIKNVGLGIAMRNGSELVKNSAKIITERDNNNSGVAFELKRVLSI